jgi:thiamine biosynthesis lipoprotein
MLVEAGVENVLINASGDIVLRGGKPEGGPWSIGIASPDDVEKYVKFFDVTDGSVATSGDYEKGAHIVDPHTGLIAIGAQSATVVGAEGWLCDAMATAVMVGGTDSAKWFGQPELQGYQVFGVNRHEDSAWEI